MKFVLGLLGGLGTIALLRWRIGLYLTLFIGFFQDVVRKLDPQQDVLYTATVIAFAVLVAAGFFLSGDHRRGDRLLAIYPALRLPVTVFVGLIILQAARGYYQAHSTVILGIGLLAYLSPILAVIIGYRYVSLSARCLSLARFYVSVAVIFLSGVYLEAMGVQSELLGSVGSGIYIYTHKMVKLVSGFLRASETAAWHGAMAAMLAMVLVTVEKKLRYRLLWTGAAMFSTGAVFLTGRRKALVEIAIFVLFAVTITLLGRRRFARAYISTVVGLLVAVIGIVMYLPFGDYFGDVDAIAYRLTTYVRSPVERVWAMTIGSFENVVSYNSVFGAGAGLGSQGAQYFGGIRTGASAESGFGKVLAEIGIFGLVVFFWLIGRVGLYARSILLVLKGVPVYEQLGVGMAAILLANIVNFMAAHQAYGDPFVILVLGLLLGLFLALPRLAYNEVTLR